MILVTGATGYIGARLIRRLAGKGLPVRALTVANDPRLSALDSVPCEIAAGDITNPQTLDKPMEDVRTVYHLAAILVSGNPALFHRINFEGTQNVLEKAVQHGVEHFVYISAAAANYKVRTTYGEAKHQAETLMSSRRGSTHFTIVRPTLVYGPNGGGQELVTYVNLLKGFPGIIPLVGCGKAMKRWVSVDDLVEGLTLLANQPVSYGKVYNFGGGSAHTMREYTEMLRDRLGLRKPIVPVPLLLCRAAAWILGRLQRDPVLKRDTIIGVTMDADFSIEEARSDLGYNPMPFHEGLRKYF